ncbi:MAG TPA: tail fiber domain-containing protein, partial [Leptospiraceae bacterium]|nr:tail fiber domain-containing protein [Leptospiraceae bacterium]
NVMRLTNASAGGSSWRLFIGDSGSGLSNKFLITYVGSAGGGILGGDAYNMMTFDKSTGNVGIGTTSPSANFQVVGTTLATAWSTSDERYKKNIQQIDNPVEKIMNLRGVNYEWKREEYKNLKFKEGKDFGFIGQEVEKVLPETVFKDNKGYLYVSYQTILPVLVEAFKKQTVQIRTTNEYLRSMSDSLETEKSRSQKLETAVRKLSDELASVRMHGRASEQGASPRSASQQENEALKKELADMKNRLRIIEQMQIAGKQ